MRVECRTKVPHQFAMISNNLAWRSMLNRPQQRPGRLGSRPDPRWPGFLSRPFVAASAQKRPPIGASGLLPRCL